MKRRRATVDEIAIAIVAFNEMVRIWAPLKVIPVEEPGCSGVPDAVGDDSRYPIVLHGPVGRCTDSVCFTTADGMTFDLRLKVKCAPPGIGPGCCVAAPLKPDDVGVAHVIESPLRARPAEPAF